MRIAPLASAKPGSTGTLRRAMRTARFIGGFKPLDQDAIDRHVHPRSKRPHKPREKRS